MWRWVQHIGTAKNGAELSWRSVEAALSWGGAETLSWAALSWAALTCLVTCIRDRCIIAYYIEKFCTGAIPEPFMIKVIFIWIWFTGNVSHWKNKTEPVTSSKLSQGKTVTNEDGIIIFIHHKGKEIKIWVPPASQLRVLEGYLRWP